MLFTTKIENNKKTGLYLEKTQKVWKLSFENLKYYHLGR